MALDDERRRLVARFEGPGVGEGRVSVAEFLRVLDDIQKSLIVVGEQIVGRSHTRGRLPQTLSEELTLDLVATNPGSFQAVLELHQPQQPMLENIGEEAIDMLLEGIDLELDGKPSDLPQAARAYVRDLASRTTGDLAKLTLQGGRKRRRVVISSEAVSQLPAMVPVKPHGPARVVGRLLEVDFKDGTAEVWDATGKMTRVLFETAMADRMKSAATLQVMAAGDAETNDQGRIRALKVDELTIVETGEEFWTDVGPAELAAQQGVVPLDSIRRLRMSAAAEDEANELIAELRQLRAES